MKKIEKKLSALMEQADTISGLVEKVGPRCAGNDASDAIDVTINHMERAIKKLSSIAVMNK